MTARVRFVLFAAVAIVLAGPVLLFFLARMLLGNDALLLDHVTERRTTLVELSLWTGADPNGPGIAELARRSGNAEILRLL